MLLIMIIINTYHNQESFWVSRWRSCQRLDGSAGVDHRLHLGVAAFGPQWAKEWYWSWYPVTIETKWYIQWYIQLISSGIGVDISSGIGVDIQWPLGVASFFWSHLKYTGWLVVAGYILGNKMPAALSVQMPILVEQGNAEILIDTHRECFPGVREALRICFFKWKILEVLRTIFWSIWVGYGNWHACRLRTDIWLCLKLGISKQQVQ